LTNNKCKGSLELNWINKDKSLLYEIDEKEGVGVKPVWVEKDDIRVSEPRILKLKEECGDLDNENMLIKGDNLLALKSLIEDFKDREEKNKIKCMYIDPPYNTGSAFEHYDDNLELSQWLTMIRDRFILLKTLLRESGVILVQINHLNVALLRNCLDEIFGRNNFVQMITVETSDPSGHATVNPGVYNAAEFILIYAKNKSFMEYDSNMRVAVPHDFSYNKVVTNKSWPYEEWIIENIQEVVAKKKGHQNSKLMKEKVGVQTLNYEIEQYALQHSDSVFQLTAISDRAGKAIVELRDISKKDKDKVFLLKREKHYDVYIYNGREMYFYSNKVMKINGSTSNTKPMTNIWTDISWNGISKEGNVIFPRSKKPEALVKRILKIFSKEDDFVLDSFLGSGTTVAVAHKMKRRWIGIELGNHAKTHCLPRLKRVVKGDDQSGISKNEDVNWEGGGGFRYYEVGESIIKELDMNWDMTLEEMSRAVFMNFDFSFIKGETYKLDGCEDEFNLGKQKGGIAICLVTNGTKIIKRQELNKLVKNLRKKHGEKKITIFTNMGVAVKPEEVSEQLDVRKIPESILKKYRMV